MSEPLVIEVVRDGLVESAHLVDVVAVDGSGRIVARAGEPERVAAFRSSAKPLQAQAARALGWEPMQQEHLAIACASHSGESGHLQAVESLLSSVGLDASVLRCPSAYSMAPGTRDVEEPLRHNCSGKHAGMLAACVSAGVPIEGYLDRDHPLQRAIAERLASSWDGPAPVVLTDGCGAPTFAGPLSTLARAFASVSMTDPEVTAMRAHPWLVGGTGRFDTDLMRAVPSLVSKGGAEALFCASDGAATIALKVRDGTSRAVGPAASLVLGRLGLADGSVVTDLVPPVTGGGRPVGALHVRGDLR